MFLDASGGERLGEQTRRRDGVLDGEAQVLRTTGERWAALVDCEDLGDERLEAAWAEDAEILCAALRTLGDEREA